MKLKNVVKVRRFFRRFNIWLYLICLLLAVVIWGTMLYASSQEAVSEDPAVCAAVTGEA